MFGEGMFVIVGMIIVGNGFEVLGNWFVDNDVLNIFKWKVLFIELYRY